MPRRRTIRRRKRRAVHAYPGNWLMVRNKDKTLWLCSTCQGLARLRRGKTVREVKQETAAKLGVICTGCDCKAG